MRVLGDWNWYLPSWLEWMPHVTREPTPGIPEPQPEPQPEARPTKA
jgi:hypothetical protein